MEPKKTPKADLERKRFVFFQIGIVVSMSMALLAFEWTTNITTGPVLPPMEDDAFEEMIDIPITRPRPPEQPKQELKPDKPSVVIQPVPEIITYTEPTEPDPEPFDPDQWFSDDDPVEPATGPAEPALPFVIVERMPAFCDCADLNTETERQSCTENARRKFMAKNTQYPWDARQRGKQGKVYVQFVVNADGEKENIQLLNNVWPSLDREALRIVKSLPCYKPGQQRGQAVPVQFSIPIEFKLQ